jgi:3-methyladenine DNA glycosylase AlkC
LKNYYIKEKGGKIAKQIKKKYSPMLEYVINQYDKQKRFQINIK